MSLTIVSIHNHGNAEEEYILLRADADVNIHKYMIADRTFKENGDLSNVHRHTFRFPSYEVKEGEFVVLLTKEGKTRVGKMDSGEKAHVFFWGSKAAIWNENDAEMAELLEVKSLETKKVAKRKLIARKSN